MKFTLEVNLGNSKLVIEKDCDGIKGLFRDAGIFSTFPSECGNEDCKSGNLALNERQTAKGEYYEITCQDCGYRKQYGQHKNNETLYPKDWEPPYVADGEEPSSGKSSGKSGGTSALQRAKAAKAKAAAEEPETEEYENSEAAAEEEAPVEKKSAAKSKSRSDILAKFGKKKAKDAATAEA